MTNQFFFSHTLAGSVLNGFLQFLASKAGTATRDRTKSPATIAMFLSVTNFIAGLQTQDWFQMHNHPGAIAAGACGVKYKTYEKHIYPSKADKLQKTVVLEKRHDGRVKINIELMAIVRKQITQWNRGLDCGPKVLKRPPPVTCLRLKNWLKTAHSVEISTQGLQKKLRKVGLIFGKGSRRYNGHEAVEHIAYRHKYIDRIKDLRTNQLHKKHIPKRTMVVIDETYLNENHVETATWYDPDDDTPLPTEQGAGRRLCIVGAGYYKQEASSQCNTRNLECGWVTNSLRMFEGGADKSKKRKSMDPHDPLDGYKGNFTAEKFMEWFECLCITLQKEHGPCDIKLDGASYHKNNIHKLPPKRKAEMKEWLVKYGVAFDENATGAVLHSLIKENRPSPRYTSQIMAEKYGHALIFTPCYHPELQEIEIIWAVAKNWCKAHPSQSFKELRVNAKFAFEEHVTAKTWAGVHKKVIKWEDYYLSEMGQDELSYDSDDEEAGDMAPLSDDEAEPARAVPPIDV